jgi:hypothetical protein
VVAPVASQHEVEVEREQFHRELMRKSMRIAELEILLDQTRNRYERSLSWRLTRPLRLAGRVWTKLRTSRPAR